jgi:hypothetical protein
MVMATSRSAPPVLLRDQVRTEGLPMLIGANHLGLGNEAQAIAGWIVRKRGSLALLPNRLQAGDGSSLSLSPIMARSLDRLNQWYGLAATESNPITHAQLESAALSGASVARIRGIFERAIRRGVRIGGAWVTPEGGGEATIDGELRLVEIEDARWSIVQEVVKVAHDPKAVARLVEARPDVAALDAHGLLKAASGRLRLGMKGADDEIRRALLTVARNTAPTFSFGSEEQLALITSRDWSGRYVGSWHTHAPHDMGGKWGGGDVPSYEDMQNAIEYGQFLTLSFQPDGFDLYDSAPLGDAKRIDLKLLKVIRYRSPAWREHFQKLHPGSR